MAKVSTNISLDEGLKKACQELFSDLGLDLTTAITVFLKQCVRVQGLPFDITRDNCTDRISSHHVNRPVPTVQEVPVSFSSEVQPSLQETSEIDDVQQIIGSISDDIQQINKENIPDIVQQKAKDNISDDVLSSAAGDGIQDPFYGFEDISDAINFGWQKVN